MDPIEIFELSGYVIDAFGNPEEWVFLSAIDLYVVQRTASANKLFASEVRSYMIVDGPNVGVAAKITSGYVITNDPKSNASADATGAFRSQLPGASVAHSRLYTVGPSEQSLAVRGDGATRHNSAGILNMHSIMYTIEIP